MIWFSYSTLEEGKCYSLQSLFQLSLPGNACHASLDGTSFTRVDTACRAIRCRIYTNATDE
ncbi:hypothetical protein BH11PLA2_BH11PLA2_47700 [soil metagenome]